MDRVRKVPSNGDATKIYDVRNDVYRDTAFNASIKLWIH